LGKAVTKSMKESSFKEGLDKGIRDLLVVFSDLPFEQYKKKVVGEEPRAEQKRAESLPSLPTSDSHSILDIDDDGYGSGSQASSGDDDDTAKNWTIHSSAGSDDGDG
jgi:hypothetical protein